MSDDYSQAKRSDAVEVNTFAKTGRGLGVKRAVYRNETVLEIYDVITARFIVENCLDIRLMLDTMNWRGRIDVLDLITIWLLTEHEKGDKSDFIGYLKSLPLTSTCPLAVPEELWSLLPNQTRIELEKDKLDFETRFERVQRVVKSSYVSTISKLTLPMFRWAYWVIRSRWVACWDYDLRNINRQWLQLGTDKDRVQHD